MGKQDKLQMFEPLVDQFTVTMKLVGKKVEYIRSSRCPYDSYDWQAPVCPSIVIGIDKVINLWISCNPVDGELIIDTDYYIADVGEYLIKIDEECSDKYNHRGDNRISTRSDAKSFLGYFHNHDDLVLTMINDIFDIIMKKC